MWTLLIDFLLTFFLAKPRKTPTIIVIALTVIIVGYAVVAIINNAEFQN